MSVVTHRRHLEQTRELLPQGDVDLVVWPETVYTRGLRLPLPISGRHDLADDAVPLLFGAARCARSTAGSVKGNSALLIGADGDDPRRLRQEPAHPARGVRCRSPMLRAGDRPVVSRGAGFRARRRRAGAPLGAWRIATPICYEAIRPEFVRRMVREADPHLIVTLANDAWFGDSQEPWLHLGARAPARRRAAPLPRARDQQRRQRGRRPRRTDRRADGLLTRENLRAVVHALDGETVYARLGDWTGWLSTAIVALTLTTSRPRTSGINPE